MRAPLLLSALFAATSLFTACEHEPAPKKAPPATAPTPAAAQDPGAGATPPTNPPPNQPPAPPPTAVTDAGVDALPPVSQDCVDVSAHIADVLISEAKDPTQKATLEQEKTKIIRRSAEACTRDSWKAEVRACFLKSTTADQMQTCAKDLAGP
ncbi:MAG: hypothetical protein IPQ07_11420 [Myxococcales bacterium]|nr:hypothetical protein [Myxococcales bacterium]